PILAGGFHAAQLLVVETAESFLAERFEAVHEGQDAVLPILLEHPGGHLLGAVVRGVDQLHPVAGGVVTGHALVEGGEAEVHRRLHRDVLAAELFAVGAKPSSSIAVRSSSFSFASSRATSLVNRAEKVRASGLPEAKSWRILRTGPAGSVSEIFNSSQRCVLRSRSARERTSAALGDCRPARSKRAAASG